MVHESLIKEVNIPELVKALRHCITKEDGITICEPCPYYCKGIECDNVLHTDAAAAIEELEKERDYYKQQYENRQRLIKCALGEERT